MVSYVGMYTRSYKKIKTRMETIIGFYGKGNEIISYHSLYVGSRLVLNSNCCACIVIVKTCCTKSIQVGLAMIISSRFENCL